MLNVMKLILLVVLFLGLGINSSYGATSYVLCIHTEEVKQAHIEKFDLKDVSGKELHINILEDKFVKFSVEKDGSFIQAFSHSFGSIWLIPYEPKNLKILYVFTKPPPVSILSSVKLLI